MSYIWLIAVQIVHRCRSFLDFEGITLGIPHTLLEVNWILVHSYEPSILWIIKILFELIQVITSPYEMNQSVD